MTNIEEINLKVAAIDGWTEIELWNPSATNKTYIGTNAAHPELGKFLPKYTESLDAIAWVFKQLEIHYKLQWIIGLKGNYAIAESRRSMYEFSGDTEAIALCKLLLAINPDPIAPPQVAIVDDDGEVEPQVFDVEFG